MYNEDTTMIPNFSFCFSSLIDVQFSKFHVMKTGWSSANILGKRKHNWFKFVLSTYLSIGWHKIRSSRAKKLALLCCFLNNYQTKHSINHIYHKSSVYFSLTILLLHISWVFFYRLMVVSLMSYFEIICHIKSITFLF